MPIGEVIFGAVFTVLLERLASREVVSFARRAGIESQLRKWSYMLLNIQTVLANAEEKQIRGDSLVNLWLQKLRELAYDLDDLLDEIAYDALAESNRSSVQEEANVLAEYFPNWDWNRRSSVKVFSNLNNELKIREISDRFEDIVTKQDLLRLSLSASGSGGSAWNLNDRSTSCVVDESAVAGRDEDKKAIIELLRQARDEVRVGVLPIIGMGGLGKTTLAQLVYNDRTVEDSFPVRAWACVSDQFDVVRITRSILESLKLTPKGTELSSLQDQLKGALLGKKFLIILDDVWNEIFRPWDLLCAPFSSGLSGSVIIVTTRNEGVASLVGNLDPYCLMQLSDDICLSIFLRYALGATSFEAHQNLADIGLKIAKRCKGLPLAAKMLGGILRNQHNAEQWLDVLQSDIWDLSRSEILPVLKLSYHHLPSHLKQCFAYCSLFPADYEFKKQDLILLWMAEGFLQPPSDQNQKKQMEELGSDYFDDLTSRSFFQPSSTGSSTFLMHDLVHQLAKHVASDAYLHVDDHNAKSQNTIIMVRHSSFVRGYYDTFKRLEAIGEMDSLRTLLALPIQEEPHGSSLSSKVLLEFLLNLTRLRVLSLCGYEIKELPDYVGQLKHLRYLNMACAVVEKLPDSITSLFNLLTLILRHCENLEELPSSIGNLVKLRYLDLDHTPKLLRMPSGIKNLTGLRKLSKFIVGEKEELGISDLKKFSSLQGKLWITGLHNVVDISRAIHASLNSKDGLKELGMVWGNKSYVSVVEEIEIEIEGLPFDDWRDAEIERQVLDHLQPPKSVQNLDIICYGGTQLPCWIGDPVCAPNIVRLRIDGCKRLTSLPPLGRLPLLKELTLSRLDGVTSMGDELCGYDDPVFARKPFQSLDELFVSDRVGWNAFPSLEKLSISDMNRWEEWSFSRGLYMLRKLVLKSCPKLTGGLPSDLPSLKELEIWKCPQLTGKLPTLSPSIEKLRIQNCPKLTVELPSDLPSLTELEIEDCPQLKVKLPTLLPSVEKQQVRKRPKLTTTPLATPRASLNALSLEVCVIDQGMCSLQFHIRSLTRLRIAFIKDLLNLNMLNSLPCLRELRINGCSNLLSFGQVSLPSTLKILELEKCFALEDLPPMHAECFLEKLHIRECDSLECFPVVEEATSREFVCWRVKSLSIYSSDKLLEDIRVHGIESLEIENCSSLMCFPARGKKLPSSLKSLEINWCENLHTLTEGMLMQYHDMPWSLEDMKINSCYSLTCFPTVGKLPTSLKSLTIESCSELAAIPGALPESSLEAIDISECRKLEELPASLVEENILSLKEVRVFDCESLRSLPSKINSLPSLVALIVRDCPAIRWSNIPQGGRLGLPLNLKELCIGKTLLPEADMCKWGLDCLTSLQDLIIDGDDMDDVISFPEYDHDHGKCFFLPTSLTSLRIVKFNNLVSLSNGLQQLSFLKRLDIWSCPKLRSLPSLPSTLEGLSISESPNMEGRYRKDGGDGWPTISHIPFVTIDDKEQ